MGCWAQAADVEGGVGQILTASLWMVGILLAGAILLTILKRIQSRREAAQPSSAQEQLAQFREAFDRGDMSAEEYQRVKGLLADNIREQPTVPPKPTGKEEEKPAVPTNQTEKTRET
jgi:hypothetical protein